MSTTIDQTLNRATTWCREARALLKLAPITALKLKSRSRDVSKKLAKLKDAPGIDNAEYNRLAMEYANIVDRVQSDVSEEDKDNLEIDVERIHELEKRIDLLLAQDSGKDRKTRKATRNLEKAQRGLEKMIAEAEPRYRKMRVQADQKLQTIRALTFGKPQELEQLINSAQAVAEANPPDYASAVHILRPFGDLFKRLQTQAQEDQEEDVLQSKAEPKYSSKRIKLEEVQEQFATEPAASEQHGLAERALAAGKDIEDDTTSEKYLRISKPLYQDAYEAMIAVVPSTTKLRKAGLQAINKARRAAEADETISSKVDQAEEALDAMLKDELLTPSEHLVRGQEIQAAMKLCQVADQRDAGLQKFDALLIQFAELRRDLEGPKSDCEKKISEIQGHLDALLPFATVEELADLAPIQREFSLAKTLYSTRAYQEALTQLTRIATETSDALAECDHTPDKLATQWAQSSGQRQRLRDECAKIKQLWDNASDLDLEIDLAGQSVSRRMTGKFVETYIRELDRLENTVESEKQYSDALNTLGQIGRAVASDLAHAELLGDFRKAIIPVKEAWGETKDALDALATALGEKEGAAAAMDFATEQMHEIGSTWEKLAHQALTPEAMEKSSAETVVKLNSLKSSFVQQATDSSAQDKLLSDAKEVGLAKQFQQALQSAEQALGELRPQDTAIFKELSARLATITDAAPDAALGYQGSLDALNTLANGPIARAINQLSTRQQTVREQVALKKKAAEKKIAELKSAAKSELRFRDRSNFEEYFEELASQLHDLDGLCNSDSIKTLEEAVRQLEAFEQQCGAVLSDLQSEEKSTVAQGLQATPPPDLKASFRMVMDSIGVIREKLGDDNIAECLPTEKVLLTEDFDSIVKEVMTLGPSEAMEKLRTFYPRLTKAIATASNAADLRITFQQTKIPEVSKQFKALTGYTPDSFKGKLEQIGKDKLAFYTALEGRIKGAKGQVIMENGEQKAIASIDSVLQDIDKALRSSDERLRMETEAQTAAHEREVNEATWKKLVEDFERMDLARANQALKDTEDADFSQLKDLKKMLKQAKSIFSDTGNFLGAKEALNNAKKYAARIIANPRGMKFTARDNLPKVQANWKNAVGQFNTSVDVLCNKIQDAEADVDSGQMDAGELQKIKDAIGVSVEVLSSTKQLFDPAAMDASIAVICNKRATTRDRRSAREHAMRSVTEYENRLRQDPVLLKLLKKPHPFGLVNLFALNAALRDLDLNIQRSV